MKVVEMCTASKPFYSRHLLEEGYDEVYYFDPDTYVYSDPAQLSEMLTDADVLITPHCCEDAQADAEIHFSEMSALAHGIYNLGFLGLKQSEAAKAVVDFWCRRLLRHCADDHGRGLFTDQKWFNHVPVFFDNVKVVKHKGCNTASWNISNRVIEKVDGQLIVESDPLIFFHFSGYDKAVPRRMFDIFGGYTDVLDEMISRYDEQIEKFTKRFPESGSEWALARYDNGELVQDFHREYYRSNFQYELVFDKPYVTGPRTYHNYITNMGEALDALAPPEGYIKRYF